MPIFTSGKMRQESYLTFVFLLLQLSILNTIYCINYANHKHNAYYLMQPEIKSIGDMLPGVGPHVFTDTQFQSPVLDNINAVIIVARLEQPLALLQLNKHHVSTQLQEQRFLKVTQHSGMHTQHTTKINESLQLKHQLSIFKWVAVT